MKFESFFLVFMMVATGANIVGVVCNWKQWRKCKHDFKRVKAGCYTNSAPPTTVVLMRCSKCADVTTAVYAGQWELDDFEFVPSAEDLKRLYGKGAQ